MELETRGEHAHTRDESACHPLDRSATLHAQHGAGERIGVLPAMLGNGDACVEIPLTPCVCCSCAVACVVWWYLCVRDGTLSSVSLSPSR